MALVCLQMADIMSTKPYISGSNYLKKMSDYSTENWGEIWDSLFWNFIAKNQEFFKKKSKIEHDAHHLE